MVNKSTLGKLIDKADMDCKDAGATVSRCQQAKQQADAQLKTLKSYKDDYSAQLKNRMADGISPAIWKNYQAFMKHLDTTIGHQKDALEGHKNKLQAGIDDWMNSNRVKQSYDALADRIRKDDQLTEKKHDQKNNDEIASRMHPTTSSDTDSRGRGL